MNVVAVDPLAPGGQEAAAGKGSVWVPAGSVVVPRAEAVVMRFRGAVPAAVLIPHVACMFLGMLWANRAGLEGLRPSGRFRRQAWVATGLLVLGGLVLGPAVQWYSFGEAWTGFPFGYDLTDNKTLVAVLGWVAALIAVERRARAARWFVFGAAVLTIVVFSIPHSVLGTELDYSTLPESGVA